ncbi:iron-containing alcohol dehydrogenase [Olsenella sp. DSM 107455]|uniref:Iron-containing alcohol dehydrogenase n=1 Tax=Thermophilibacter gallinarum TaxID=2779357 RepID=A0ABR9QS43_9ACTN|nr:iron-containing alcohol dehydrogenase [Thermophilibacter gallinarum]MBE5023895.1 iron-containing alcohol dehydrogenase [Thermophilibacter gallinarum]
MVNFEYLVPTKVVFGKDTECETGRLIKECGGTKALIHWGGDYVRDTGLLDRIEKSMDEAGVGYVEFDGVVPNPRLSLVKEGVELCRREGVDFVLAIGGGSAIDSSKAIAYGLANDFELEDLFLHKVTTDKIAKLGAVSTLAGTGSETSNSTVIDIDTMGEKVLKRSYNHECARPLFAIMNPELTYSLPAFQTAAPGADIMMHTMERYFTREKGTQLIDAMSEGLMRTVRAAVPAALADPTSYEARANLMWAGSLSHCGLTGTGLVGDFASHAIGQELGAMFDMAHGVSLTAIWSTWAKYVLDVRPERFAQFGVNVFGVVNDFDDVRATALRGIEAWDQWCHSIGMPTSLSEAGVSPTDEQIHEMAVSAVEARGGDHAGAFMELHVEDIEQILKNAR